MHSAKHSHNLLFAYGSLITGSGIGPIDRIMAKARIIGRGFVHGRLYDLGNYPGAVLTKNPKETIAGIVYRVPASAWTKLDAYEGLTKNNARNSEFLRQRASVHGVDGLDTLHCWIYIYNGRIAKKAPIPDGDYTAYLRRQSGGSHR